MDYRTFTKQGANAKGQAWPVEEIYVNLYLDSTQPQLSQVGAFLFQQFYLHSYPNILTLRPDLDRTSQSTEHEPIGVL